MPLHKGKSKKVFKENISEMVAAGHPVNQSVAAAYAQKRKAEHMKKHWRGGEVKSEYTKTSTYSPEDARKLNLKENPVIEQGPKEEPRKPDQVKIQHHYEEPVQGPLRYNDYFKGGKVKRGMKK